MTTTPADILKPSSPVAETARLLYQGATAESLGFSPEKWASRKATLEVFMMQWRGNDETFVSDYTEWIGRYQHLRPPAFPGTEPWRILRYLPPEHKWVRHQEIVTPHIDTELVNPDFAPRELAPDEEALISEFKKRNPGHEPPPIKDLIKNFLSSSAEHAKSGFKHVEDSQYASRLEFCATCEFYIDGMRCAKCGCYMAIKARWQSSKCPLAKWEE